jgi:hypothetical protein
MKIAIENAGAEKGFLILEKAGNWTIEAEGSVNRDEVSVLRSLPLNATADSSEIPLLATANRQLCHSHPGKCGFK